MSALALRVSTHWGRMPRRQRLAGSGLAVLAIMVGIRMCHHGGDVKNRGAAGPVVAFGDSLTEGYGADAGQSYPDHLSRLWGETVINAGVSGDTSDDGLDRLEADCLSHRPGLVLLEFGANDFFSHAPLESVEKNLREMIRRIQDEGAAVVVIGLNIGGLTDDYEGMYAKVAKEERCALVEDWMDGLLRKDDLMSDDVHPNGKGYKVLAERVDKIARPLR